MNINNLRNNSDTLARCLVLFGICFIPVSPTLTATISLAMLFALFGRQLWANAALVWRYPSVYPMTIFLLLLFVGIFINDFSYKDGLHGFIKYGHKLLMLLILIPLFFEAKWRRYALNVFIFAAIVYVSLIYLHFLSMINLDAWFGKFYIVVMSPIPFSIFVSFASFILMHRIIDTPNYRVLNSVLLSVLIYFLLFINVQRSGYVLLFVLTYLFIIQQVGLKGILLGLIIMPMLVLFSYVSSEKVSNGVHLAIGDISQLLKGNEVTSVGLRIHFAAKSIQLVKENPWFGHGTGSFAKAYEKVGGTPLPSSDSALGDPHNVYASLAVQLGLVGLSAFMIWLLVLLNDTFSLPKPEQFLAQGIIICLMAGGALFEDTLLRSKIATLVLVFLAILFAAKHSTKAK